MVGGADDSRHAVRQRWALALLVLWLTAACASGPESGTAVPGGRREGLEGRLRTEAHRWEGTPHRLGGISRKGIDCSGLVMQIYRHLFDIRLPRMTQEQLQLGRVVPPEDLQPGDLVFFRPPRKPRHVGIYLGRGEFVHASKTRGVMISRLDEGYWQDFFFAARRIL